MSKKVLVFGGSGFIGSHVCDELTRTGYGVTIFDIKKSPYLLPGQKMILGDILDEAQISEAIRGNDIVMNFAGIADIDQCARDRVNAVKYNVLGNTHILEACVYHKVKRYVFASSAYVYSNSGAIYKDTKQACENFIDTYRKLFGLEYTIVRYGSLYGTRSDSRNSIYRIITEALKEGKIDYIGTGKETREYIHVLDAARLTIEILKEKYANEHIVLTGSQTMKYEDLLSMIKEMLDDKITVNYIEPKERGTHYKLTPYAFTPKLGKKLVNNPFIDMGQGLLELMKEIYEKQHSENDKTGTVNFDE